MQKTDPIVEAFSCFIVHNPEEEKEKEEKWQKELSAAMTGITAEQQESAVRQFLILAGGVTNDRRLDLLLSMLENLVNTSVLPAR